MDADLPGDLSAFGWRAVVLVLIVGLLTYVLVAWIRMRRIHRGTATGAPDGRSNAAAKPATLPAVAERRLENLEAELAQTRAELSALRAAFASLREDVEQRSESVSTQLKAVQHVSPIYGDAMQMALAGEPAATISERCGIARAEAELVVALVRQRAGDAGGEEGNDGEQFRY